MWVTWSYFRLEWIIYVLKEGDVSILMIYMLYVAPLCGIVTVRRVRVCVT